MDNSGVVDQALEILTDREMERSPTRDGNPDRHRAAVRRGKHTSYASEAHRLHHLNPDLTPTALADLIQPASNGRNYTDPAWGGETARRYDIPTAEETQARLETQRAEAATIDRSNATQLAAQARQALRQPDLPASNTGPVTQE